MSINSLIIRPMIPKLLGVHAYIMSEDNVVLIVSVRIELVCSIGGHSSCHRRMRRR
jgi:hypothetical protein